jgi:hypothetical protein
MQSTGYMDSIGWLIANRIDMYRDCINKAKVDSACKTVLSDSMTINQIINEPSNTQSIKLRYDSVFIDTVINGKRMLSSKYNLLKTIEKAIFDKGVFYSTIAQRLYCEKYSVYSIENVLNTPDSSVFIARFGGPSNCGVGGKGIVDGQLGFIVNSSIIRKTEPNEIMKYKNLENKTYNKRLDEIIGKSKFQNEYIQKENL